MELDGSAGPTTVADQSRYPHPHLYNKTEKALTKVDWLWKFQINTISNTISIKSINKGWLTVKITNIQNFNSSPLGRSVLPVGGRRRWYFQNLKSLYSSSTMSFVLIFGRYPLFQQHISFWSAWSSVLWDERRALPIRRGGEVNWIWSLKSRKIKEKTQSE